MDDRAFDKQFSDKLRQAGAPDFSDEDWEKLSPRLDSVQRKQWRMLPLWWLGVLSGLLLCSNVGWWWMWKQTEKQHEVLETSWKNFHREAVTMHDTTYSKIVVYQFDTIYRTLSFRTVLKSDSATQGMATQLDPANSKLLPTLSAPVSRVETNHFQPGVEAKNEVFLQDKVEQMATYNWVAGSTEFLPIQPFYLKLPPRHFKIPEKELAVVPQKQTRVLHLPILLPRKFRFGLDGGLVIPVATQWSGNNGFSIGLISELAFSDQLALSIGANYSGVSFNGKVYEERLGLPPLISPGDDYILKHFETEEGLKPIYQINTGLRYWLRSTRRMSPYLGLGYAAQWHPEFELKLEYYDPVLDKETELTLEVPSLGKPISMLEFNGGVRIRLLSKLALQTGATYQFKLDAGQPGIPQFWGIKSAALYSF